MDIDPTTTSGLMLAAAGVGRLIFDFCRWHMERRDRQRPGYGRVVSRMTAPGGWCVEVILLDRLDGYPPVQRFRVTRMGAYIGEVADPRQLARLGAPMAELVE